MSSLRVFEAFHAELEKLAIDYHAMLGGAGAGGGVGALVGGVGGGLIGGVRSYRKTRREGGTVGQGLASSAGGTLHGAGTGALLGAGAGAVAGGMAPHLVSGLPAQAGVTGAFGRFGQRQVHGVTGWLPTKGVPSSLESIRGGAYAARKAQGEAGKALETARLGTDAGAIAKAERAHTKATASFNASDTAQTMGLTNVPGYAKKLFSHPLQTARASAAEQWHSGGIGSKALLVGFPAVSTIGAIRAHEQPTGKGKGENIGRELGSTVGGVLTSPLPLVTGGAVQSAFARAGGTVGRGVDRLRGRRPGQLAPAPENVAGQHVPTERVMSPSAAGQRPEIPT